MKKFLIMMFTVVTFAYGNCEYYKQQMDYFYDLYVNSNNPYEKQSYYDIFISYQTKLHNECSN